MTRSITVHSAKPSDIWPDGSGLSAEAEREIIAIARTEISADDVARSGLVFSQWYIPYYLAEGRWRQREVQQAEKKQRVAVTESANARRIARLERRLAATTKDLRLIYETLLSKPEDDPDGELRLFRLIRNIAWSEIVDHKVMRDCGVWDGARLYGPGAAVSAEGALWIAQRETQGERPPGDAWRLALKTHKSMVARAVRDELEKQKGQ
jgi:hypothetical protein